MDKFVVKGGARLRGEVTISGSKNAGLPIMAAALLCEGPTVISGVPCVSGMYLSEASSS